MYIEKNKYWRERFCFWAVEYIRHYNFKTEFVDHFLAKSVLPPTTISPKRNYQKHFNGKKTKQKTRQQTMIKLNEVQSQTETERSRPLVAVSILFVQTSPMWIIFGISVRGRREREITVLILKKSKNHIHTWSIFIHNIHNHNCSS